MKKKNFKPPNAGAWISLGVLVAALKIAEKRARIREKLGNPLKIPRQWRVFDEIITNCYSP